MQPDNLTVNGVPIPFAAAPANTREITLPSGARARIRKGVGGDLLHAARAAKEPGQLIYALAAELVEIDGRHLAYEQILDLSIADVLAIQNAVNEDNFPHRSSDTGDNRG